MHTYKYTHKILISILKPFSFKMSYQKIIYKIHRCELEAGKKNLLVDETKDSMPDSSFNLFVACNKSSHEEEAFNQKSTQNAKPVKDKRICLFRCREEHKASHCDTITKHEKRFYLWVNLALS